MKKTIQLIHHSVFISLILLCAITAFRPSKYEPSWQISLLFAASGFAFWSFAELWVPFVMKGWEMIGTVKAITDNKVYIQTGIRLISILVNSIIIVFIFIVPSLTP